VNLVLSATLPGTVRLTVPAGTRTDQWAIQQAELVGDVNGDGQPDLAVSVDHLHLTSAVRFGGDCNPPPPPLPHQAYVQVIFGGSLPARINLAAPFARGFRISAPAGSEQFGASLAAAGDVNGDGLGDLIVGAPAGVDQPGAAYVVFGKRSTAPVATAKLGNAGFRIDGPAGSQVYQAGIVVSGGGDVNGDGHPDLLIGSQWRTPELVDGMRRSQCGDALFIPPAHSARSVAYVVFGGQHDRSVELGDLGSSGLTIGDSPRLEAASGSWLANAGDVNGDGLADVVIGSQSGAFVVFGRRTGGQVGLDPLGGGIALRVPVPNAAPVSRSVAGIGDLNGDGLADFAVAVPNGGGQAPVGSAQAQAPSGYVVFGRSSTSPIDLSKLGAGGLELRGTRDNAGSSVVGLGDLNGDGRPDFGELAPSTPYGGRLGSGSLYAIFGGATTGALPLASLGGRGVRIDGGPNMGVYESGGAASMAGRVRVLVYESESAELVPFRPRAAPHAPRLAAQIGGFGPRLITGITSGLGSVWLLAESGDHQHGLVDRLNPKTNELVGRPVQIGGPSRVISTGFGAVWALVVPRHRDRAATLVRIDPATDRILLRAKVGGPGRDIDQTVPADTINAGLGSLWITYAATGSVYRIDPETGFTTAAIRVGLYPQALAFAAGNVWVADRQDGAVREIDPETNRVVGRPLDVARQPASQGRALGDMLWMGTAEDGGVWLYDPNHDQVARLDPRTRRLSFDAPSGAAGEVAVADTDRRTLWIVGSRSTSRVRISDGLMAGGRLEADTWPVGAAVTGNAVWTTTLGTGVLRIDR
jgi:streptogramin lyase